MRTVIQDPGFEYDIDDGVVFTKESLKGPRGGEMSSIDARKMVCDCGSTADSFGKAPEVKTNCVRCLLQRRSSCRYSCLSRTRVIFIRAR